MRERLKPIGAAIKGFTTNFIRNNNFHLFREYGLRDGNTIREKMNDLHCSAFRITGTLLQYRQRDEIGNNKLEIPLRDGRKLRLAIANPKNAKFPDEVMYDKKGIDQLVIEIIPEEKKYGAYINHRLKSGPVLFLRYGGGEDSISYIEGGKIPKNLIVNVESVFNILKMYADILNFTERQLQDVARPVGLPF